MKRDMLIQKLEKDFINLADNYDDIYIKIKKNKKSLKQLININPIFLTEEMLIEFSYFYYEDEEWMDEKISDYQNIWNLVIHFSVQYSYGFSKKYVKEFLKRLEESDSQNKYYYKGVSGYINSINFNNICIHVVENANCPTLLLQGIKKHYEKQSKNWYSDKIEKISIRHSNYNKIANMILDEINQ